MKKIVLMMLLGVASFMFLVPSIGYSNPSWRRGPQRTEYVVVRDHGSRYYRPAPVRYHQERVRYVERREEDRSGQVAVAAIGGIVIGTLLGTVITQGR